MIIFLKIHLVMHMLELLNSSIPGLGRYVVPQLLELLPILMSWAIPVQPLVCVIPGSGDTGKPLGSMLRRLRLESGVVNLELVSSVTFLVGKF